MSTWVWIAVAAVAAVWVLCVFGVLARVRRRRSRSERLRREFGPEYGRVIELAPDRREAERTLVEREERYRTLDISPLPSSSRQHYVAKWRDTQARFVDDPGGAVHEAERLVEQVLTECGYPVGDFDQRAADVSVGERDLLSNYRSAHDVRERHLTGGATTEELRHAMVDYRSLFDRLLEDSLAAAR